MIRWIFLCGMAACFGVGLIAEYQLRLVRKDHEQIALASSQIADLAQVVKKRHQELLGVFPREFSVFFNTNEAILMADDSAVIRQVGITLTALDCPNIRLTGYADISGDSTKNFELAQARISTIRTAIQNLALPLCILKIEEVPLGDTLSFDESIMYRRVDIDLVE